MTAAYWIEKLELEAHPECGYYKEVYRNPSTIQIMQGGGTRNLSTSIYFLLEGNQKSHFHQLAADELWYYHTGSAACIHILESGSYRSETIGLNIESGESPQVLLPRQSIFAAELVDKSGFILLGCMVNPGFDFKDFRLVDRAELLPLFPEHQSLIEDFTLS